MDGESANWVIDGITAVVALTALVCAIVVVRVASRAAREARESARFAANAADDAWQRVFTSQQLTTELRAEIQALRIEIANLRRTSHEEI